MDQNRMKIRIKAARWEMTASVIRRHKFDIGV